MRLLAAVACTSLLWTTLFAKVVGLPPVPLTADYRAKVHRDLMRSWESGEQITNTAIQACASRGFSSATRISVARRKCDRILADMEGIAANAQAAQAVRAALACGLRLVDCAASYRNEREVGHAVPQSNAKLVQGAGGYSERAKIP